ncbi:beta-lactamase family protein [Zavarzinia compransoris]|uniref:serine hydrolase domain-containing protein n=1 Tax=Zavarzinia marina TaxID=2911065 RepID=UPI001F25DC80|nr:serine hydrolase domain-containing protein [Zavarzinia marina]MCF4164249.1 beta-lactamase family protein [Zavarzinia marina]
MPKDMKAAADAVLAATVARTGGVPDSGVPGVVALATDAKGTIYAGAAGRRSLADPAPMTEDTVFAIFSCTKAVTGTAILQLVEDGLLDLDAPARTYVPAIADIQVLDGFCDEGNPRLRAPKREITTRMLMLHTAGFGYSFFCPNLRDYEEKTGLPPIIACARASLDAPLTFEPGEKWQYGISIDWCGLIVEAITGKRLGTVMAERIFQPLGMTDTGFTRRPDMEARMATIHQRMEDGSLVPMPELRLPNEPEVQLGGAGLHSTVGDYGRFIRMWLNDGAGENGRVLKPETVAMAARNGLGDLKVTPLASAIPTLTRDAEFFPGMPKSWALSFMVNEEPAPTGRSAGALAWAGLANLFYWIDREQGLGGFWATQILPFADPASVGGYLGFEKAIYDSVAAARAA